MLHAFSYVLFNIFDTDSERSSAILAAMYIMCVESHRVPRYGTGVMYGASVSSTIYV